MMEEGLSISMEVRRLFDRQLAGWPQAGDNYRALAGVETREERIGGFPVKIQFNPARIVSSAAKVDTKSIKERKCFLCEENRPAVQEGIDYEGEAGNYTILVNPFPIFPRHLTIPDKSHIKQQIRGRYGDMLDLARLLDEYVLFYNGPRCGASAPDHMHFQAGNKGFLPMEMKAESLKKELLAREGEAELFAVGTYARGVFLIESSSREDAEKLFEGVYSVLPVKEGEWEPMLNILTWCVNAEGARWSTVIFIRDKHRPACYFAQGEENILLSPASVDLGGVFITPLEKDFRKVDAARLKDILDEIAPPAEEIGRIKAALKRESR